ncbi:MAG: chemotaxis protein CheW [Desulfitobacteriaceae bacterium]
MASQVVIFALGQEEYGMPIEVVREITRLGDVRPIPQAPSFVRGLINLRGEAIPLIDLHIRFGIDKESGAASADSDDKHNLFALITEVQGSHVGFAVDQVREVRVLEEVVPPPPLVTAPFISGVVNLPDRIIIQLLPERILEDDEIRKLNDIISV